MSAQVEAGGVVAEGEIPGAYVVVELNTPGYRLPVASFLLILRRIVSSCQGLKEFSKHRLSVWFSPQHPSSVSSSARVLCRDDTDAEENYMLMRSPRRSRIPRPLAIRSK